MLTCWQKNVIVMALTLSLQSRPAFLEDSECLVGDGNCSDRTATPASKPVISQSSDDIPLMEDENACNGYSDCSKLPAECLKCDFNYICEYGTLVNVTCRPKVSAAACNVNQTLTKSMTCQFCYQTAREHHSCVKKAGCHSSRVPRDLYTTNCTVGRDTLCLGSRTFLKNVECNWTSGYKWTTTMILSITMGGFGADRFYLGHWQEGMGKLFSFGGLGVWTLVDVVLIAVGYLKPADGSLYI